MKQNASYICRCYKINIYNCKYVCCYTYHYLSREYGKRLQTDNIIVEENADSIIPMDSHIAESHSKQ